MKKIAIIFLCFISCQEKNQQPHIVEKIIPVEIDPISNNANTHENLKPAIPIPESYTWIYKEMGQPMLQGRCLDRPFQIFEMDSCQWIANWESGSEGGPLFSHWGKCKYCAARRQKELDQLYQKIKQHIDSIVIATAYGNSKKIELLLSIEKENTIKLVNLAK